MVKIQNLTKSFKKFKALDDVSLELPKGRIIGLLGKNGAGKSTLMRTMLGFLKYEGSITLNGMEVWGNRQQVFRTAAFIPDVDSLDQRLTVRQSIKMMKSLHPLFNDATSHKLLEKSALPLDLKVGKLSKGMKTKLYLLMVLSLDVELLLLDEPTLGLDIAFRKEFFNTILGEFFDENKTIVISTHQVEEVEHIIQDIIFIDRGKITLHENMDELKARYRIVTVPRSAENELKSYNPLTLSYSLGHVSGILPAEIEIPGAEYERPLISDIFLAKVGGSNV